MLLSVALVACGGNDTTPDAEVTEATDATDEIEATDDATGDTDAVEGEAEDMDSELQAEADAVQDFTDANTLVVGTSDLTGDFVNGFTNNVYDIYVKRTIGTYGGDLGYATTYADDAGEYHVNPVVVDGEPERVENEDGSVTYTFKIQEDLMYNDGTPITAKNYVFATLLNASPAWMLTGANNSASGENLLGFDEYHDGTTNDLAGMQLVDDYTFNITIRPEKLPYYFELAMISSTPSPMHRLAPNLDVEGGSLIVREGYEVTDEDRDNLVQLFTDKTNRLEAAYNDEVEWYTSNSDNYEQFNDENIANWEAFRDEMDAAGEDAEMPEDTDPEYGWLYSARYKPYNEAKTYLEGLEAGTVDLDPRELLLETAANELAFNFRFNPDVTCGPYQLVSYQDNIARLEINENFKTDVNGNKPQIQNIVIQGVNTQIDVELVIAGKTDLAPQINQGAKIDKAKDNGDKVSFVDYPRNGYGLLNILNDVGATQYKGVRQAIAYSIDRNEFVSTIQGGYGVVINGSFGLAESEYIEKGAEFDEQAIAYTLNVDAANQALDTDSPYTFEADGTTPWDAEKAIDAYNSDKENFDYWRYDAEGNQLRIIHEGTEGVEVSNLIAAQLPDNAKQVGMQYIVNIVDWGTLSEHYTFPDANNPDAPTVFNMGTGFAIPHDPYYQFHSSLIGVGDNKNRVSDPELDELLVANRQLNPDDREGWLDGWLKFQLWYNENVPNIPLYSDQYHDIFSNRVQGMENVTSFWDFSNVICALSLSE